MFYPNLITFIRNRDEPLNFRFSARNNKKSLEDKFDEKFLHVVDDYVKGNLFDLSSSRKDLLLTRNTITNYSK